MHEPPAFTQNRLRRGVVEFAVGEPDPSLLPVALTRDAAAAVLGQDGPGALAYGSSAGPGPLRREIAARVAAREGRALAAGDVLVTGGNSQAIDLALTTLTSPGDTVLVESPTYDLAVGIMRDHPVRVVGIPIDDDGLDVEALLVALSRIESGGDSARLLYTVPTFHNPAGMCLSTARRTRLLRLARERDLVVLEDDVYRELVYDGEAPASLWALDPDAPVIRMGSFSKSLAPGLRVGWVNARHDLRERLAASGMLESGGCVSQFSAHVVAALLADGGYDAHVDDLRRTYGSRRDALTAALAEHLPAGCRFTLPAGGFFLWVTLPDGLSASALLPIAERHRVSFAPGARFCSDGDDGSLRLSFSLYDEATLTEGARRLGESVAAALAGHD